MIKKIKKMLSIVMAFAMVLTMALSITTLTAKAASGTHNITITGANNSSDTFKAYQVFAGELSGGKLTKITWGDGVNGEALLIALKAEENSPYASCNTAEDVAKILATYRDDSDEMKAFAAKASANKTKVTSGTPGNTQIKGVADGYYLIESDSTATDSAKTRFILEVAGADGKVSVKSDVPTSEKKVIDKNDSTKETSDWQDSADHDINDEIDYQIKAFLPDNVSDYPTYYLDFVDTMSKGLTYVKASSKVYVASYTEDENGNKTISNKTPVNVTLEPTSVDFTGTGAPEYVGGKVFTWKIDNVKAAPYNAGNKSVIIIEYKAKLNENAVIGSEGNPNKMHIDYSNNPNVGGDGETGHTPDDTNIVFTYQLTVNKTDEKGKDLDGATFTLLKKDSSGEYVEVEKIIGTNQHVFEFKGLDDGDYKIEEIPPAGYNGIDPIEFTITAGHTTLADNPTLDSLQAGSFTINTIKGSVKPTGFISTKIKNKSGSTLPSTGGIGTTIFYILGIILMLGAGIVLVTRKRMSR